MLSFLTGILGRPASLRVDASSPTAAHVAMPKEARHDALLAADGYRHIADSSGRARVFFAV